MTTVQEIREGFPSVAGHLSDGEIEALLPALDRRKLRPGDFVTTQGESTDTLHLVVYGALSVHLDQGGERLALGHAGPGSVVGEIGLVEPGPASASIEALEEVVTLELPRTRFDELATEEPAAASALLHALSQLMAARLRASSHGLLRRVGDHEWLSIQARDDRPGWLERMARLLGAGGDGRNGGASDHGGTP